MVSFDNDLLRYWLNSNFTLESSEDLHDPWSPVKAASPIEVTPDLPQLFFRLMGN